MRKWGNVKKNRTFFVLLFQHRPYFDIVPDIGKIATLPNKNRPRVDIVREVCHNYNHKPPKMSRKKNYKSPRRTCTRSRAAAPLFAMRKGDINPPEIDRPNAPRKPTPKPPRKRHQKPAQNRPENTPPNRSRITNRQASTATPKPAPRFAGSGLGPPRV